MLEAVVKSKNGIHARPASMIANLSSKYQGEINLYKSDKKYNGKSIMSIMSMGLQENEVVSIEVIGDQADEMELAIKEIIDNITD
ncbi:HPr family phosphocarrier protein [Fusibacter bizertensis]